MDKIKSDLRNSKPSLIIDQKLRDWNGQTIFKSKTSSSDRMRSFESFKTIIDKSGMPFNIEWKKNKWDDVKQKLKKRTDEEKEKMKKYFKNP